MVGEELRFRSAVLGLDLDDCVGDGEGDLDRQEGTDQVEDAGEGDCHLGLEGTGGDGRRHRVAGVVEAIGEVERQCRDDDEHEENEREIHTASVQPRSGL